MPFPKRLYRDESNKMLRLATFFSQPGPFGRLGKPSSDSTLLIDVVNVEFNVKGDRAFSWAMPIKIEHLPAKPLAHGHRLLGLFITAEHQGPSGRIQIEAHQNNRV